MKKRTSTRRACPAAVFLIALIACCAVPAIASADDLTYSITAGEYRITQDGQGQSTITMLSPAYSSTGSPGDPLLPERLIELRVPIDIVWGSVKLTVEVLESQVLDG